MVRKARSGSLLFLAVLLSSCATPAPVAVDSDVSAMPKNVILFISDGTGPASMTLARDFLRHEGTRQQLHLDAILTGALETWSADHLITGSGAAATAMASGYKSNNLTIGQDADGNPVRSILEKAEAAGFLTGAVVTREVYDATPASFTAHVNNRYNDRDDIVSQQLSSGIDILVGGGRDHFVPQANGGRRTDGRNMLAEARAMGYTVVHDKEAWDAVQSLPVIALLEDGKLPYDLDRNPALTPSLAEMTRKSIDLLDQSDSRFFLLVEGSRIDLAGHDNDAPAHVRDLIAYDEAVKVALDFARADGETLVIATSDHETGGLAVGSNYTWYPEVLAAATASHDTVATRLLENPESVRSVFREFYGIDDLSEEEIDVLASAETRNQYDRALGEVIGGRAFLHWASLGHTAVDVNLYAFGPGAEHFRGHFNNVYIGKKVPQLLGVE